MSYRGTGLSLLRKTVSIKPDCRLNLLKPIGHVMHQQV